MAYYDDDYYSDEYADRVGKGSQLTGFVRSGRIVSTTGIERIIESMKDILSTMQGTRFFKPEYGSRIYKVIMEQNDYIVQDLLRVYVKEDIERWDPRIIVNYVESEIDANSIDISIGFTVKDTGDTSAFKYTINRQLPKIV